MNRSQRKATTLLSACVLLWALNVFSQTTTGTIFGVVRDQSGAVIPGVAVTVRNEGIGLVREFVSSETGSFNFPALPPGRYSVTAELSGFQRFVESGITLEVNQNFRVDVVLGVSAQSDQVLVEAASTAQVETRSVAVGHVVEQKRMVELPLNGRNYLELTLLQPGVIPTLNPPSVFNPKHPGSGAPQVGGLRGSSNNFLLDGAENNELFYGEAGAVPSPDTLAEFRIITNSYSAEFGRGGGSVVNAITRSGTNELHGGVYEFLRNDVFDARNFFAPTKPQLKRNQFGGFLGGPVVRNRTFFFGAYEGFRLREGTTRVAVVPTLLERRGDFSQSAGKPVNPDTRQRFPNDQIPSSLLNPVASKMLEFYPEPNLGVDRFVSSPVARTDRDQFTAKVDYNWKQTKQSFIRYFFDQGDNYDPFGAGNDVPTFPTAGGSRFQNAALSHTYVSSPATVNVFRFAYGRAKKRTLFPAVSRNGRDYGFTFSTVEPQDVPGVSITGYSSLGFRAHKAAMVENTFAGQYSLLHTRGNHSIKAGGDIRAYQVNSKIQTFATGAHTINGSFSGSPFADFLLGRSARFNIVGGRMDRYFRANAFSTYFQDDVRVHPRLTLNLGVRYEFVSPITETQDRLNAFRPGQQSTVQPAAPTGMVFPGDSGISRSTVQTDKNNFAPRIGLAWDMSGNAKTSLRLGYGVYYDTGLPVHRVWQALASPPATIQLIVEVPPSFADPVGPTSPIKPGATSMPFPRGMQLFAVMDKDTRTTYVQQYNATLQRNLFGDFLVDVGYVGTMAHKLTGLVQANPALFIPGQSTRANINDRRIYTFFNAINTQGTQFNSNYHSLQASLNKRFSRGYSLQISHTWAKTMDIVSGHGSDAAGAGQSNPMDPYNLRRDYGPAAFDVRHRFVANSVWELPRLKNSAALPRHLLGGWQLSGIFQTQTGSPLTVLDGSDPNLDGGSGDRPDLIGDPQLSKRTPERWFNTGAFRRVPTGCAGVPITSPLGCFGNSGRNIVRGPGLNKVDVSITRNFEIGEKGKRAQFRTEVFNLFNHPSFRMPESTIGTSTFGKVLNTRGSDERILQFGLRVDF